MSRPGRVKRPGINVQGRKDNLLPEQRAKVDARNAEICRLRAEGVSIKALAVDFKLSHQYVNCICGHINNNREHRESIYQFVLDNPQWRKKAIAEKFGIPDRVLYYIIQQGNKKRELEKWKQEKEQ